jgi:hypothetical protein
MCAACTTIPNCFQSKDTKNVQTTAPAGVVDKGMWLLGAEGSSCDDVCNNAGAVCDEDALVNVAKDTSWTAAVFNELIGFGDWCTTVLGVQTGGKTLPFFKFNDEISLAQASGVETTVEPVVPKSIPSGVKTTLSPTTIEASASAKVTSAPSSPPPTMAMTTGANIVKTARPTTARPTTVRPTSEETARPTSEPTELMQTTGKVLASTFPPTATPSKPINIQTTGRVTARPTTMVPTSNDVNSIQTTSVDKASPEPSQFVPGTNSIQTTPIFTTSPSGTGKQSATCMVFGTDATAEAPTCAAKPDKGYFRLCKCNMGTSVGKAFVESDTTEELAYRVFFLGALLAVIMGINYYRNRRKEHEYMELVPLLEEEI